MALRHHEKLLYTVDMIGGQALAQTRNLWLLFFLAPPVGEGGRTLVPGLDIWGFHVDPRPLAGALLTVGRIIEAIDDPLIGYWSDNTRSRWGRRIPFILFSTPFMGVFFALLWLVPTGEASVINAVYVFLILEFFFLTSSLSGQPYEALLPEIARTNQERVGMVAWQFYFGIVGAVFGLVVSGVLKDLFGFLAMGSVIAALGVMARYAGLRGVWRAGRSQPKETKRTPLLGTLRSTLQNKQFLYFLPTFLLFQLSLTMIIAWLPFFVEEVLQAEDAGIMTSVLTGSALLSMVLSTVVLRRLATTRGKRWVYLACLLGTSVLTPLLFLAGFVPGVPKLVQGIIMTLLLGMPLAGVNLLPRAITADITDYDAIRTGARHEAMFYAAQNLFEKIGLSFAPLLLGIILLLGDTMDDPLGIRLVGPAAGVITIFGFLIFRQYRLPDEVTPESVKSLEKGTDSPRGAGGRR
jgi:GPH family glycoside/pentoside/hexuronide:cation symporter